MPNSIESDSEGHSEPEPKRGISGLLPRYYEEFSNNPTYESLVSYFVNDHEVAWMQFNGVVEHDITGEGKEGKPFEGRSLYCECDFQEVWAGKLKIIEDTALMIRRIV